MFQINLFLRCIIGGVINWREQGAYSLSQGRIVMVEQFNDYRYSLG
ncbi:hypothetical protein I5F07_00595 [Proteus vulgaris]|nr:MULTISPECIES: hypothetical protein [Proteus]NBN60894.1 hypothetical protein [Proteus sp. G2639]MBG5983367.1 hypothetical protein [Proteus vulgaris]MBI6510161.1 hypothetical protein [Proteus sp. PR00174]MCH4254628.1 hypothetical protein [Proteus vulgaris]NBN46858.1 hypothetical protein [Proteus sp. G2626]